MKISFAIYLLHKYLKAHGDREVFIETIIKDNGEFGHRIVMDVPGPRVVGPGKPPPCQIIFEVKDAEETARLEALLFAWQNPAKVKGQINRAYWMAAACVAGMILGGVLALLFMRIAGWLWL